VLPTKYILNGYPLISFVLFSFSGQGFVGEKKAQKSYYQNRIIAPIIVTFPPNRATGPKALGDGAEVMGFAK
jgi:hypothetical protein